MEYPTPAQYHYGWGLLLTALVLSTVGDATFLVLYASLKELQSLPEMPAMVSWIIYNLVLSAGCLVFCALFSHHGAIYGGFAACNAQAFFSGFSLMGVLLSAALMAHVSEVHIRTGKVLERKRMIQHQSVVLILSAFFAIYSSIWPVHGAPVPGMVYCIIDFLNPASAVMIGAMLLVVVFIISRYVLLVRRVHTMTTVLRAHNMPLIAKQRKLRSIRAFAGLVGIFVVCCAPASIFMLIDLIAGRHIVGPTLFILAAFSFHASASIVPFLAIAQSKPVREAFRGSCYRLAKKEPPATGFSLGMSMHLIPVLRDPQSYQGFYDHCKAEQNEENILFWSKVESFRQSFSAGSKQDPQHLAREIDLLFVHEPDAPLEINLSAQSRSEITEAIKDPSKLSPSTFDNAQGEVVQTLERDTFPRFLVHNHHRLSLSTSVQSVHVVVAGDAPAAPAPVDAPAQPHRGSFEQPRP